MIQINNNNYIDSKSVKFGEQPLTAPIPAYNTRYLQQAQGAPQLPDIYTIDDSDKPSFKETFTEGPAGMMFKPWIEHPLATLGTFIGLGFGMDWFAKKCGGNYEESLLGKVANFGDKIQNSSFVQSESMKKTGGFLSNISGKIKNFLGKSDALKAANEMSIQAENQMAKSMTYTTAEEAIQEFSHHIAGADGIGLNAKEFTKPINLKNLYIDKDVKQFIKDTYGKSYRDIKHTAEAEKIANHITLKRLGIDENEISKIINDTEGTIKTKAKILEVMGKDLKEPLTPELLQKIADNPKEYKDIVRKIAENTKGKVWCAAGDYEWMGPVTRFFKRKISIDGTYNKLNSIAKDSGHTATGNFLSKAVQTMYRGFTFGGGKLGAFLFIAPGLVEMAINTHNADRDKKVGTATWGFINAVSWPITFLLGAKMMYGAASMHNAGISKENLTKIDDIINKFNLKNENREFKSLGEYFKARKACKKEIKALRKVEGMSVFDRMLKKVSGILSYDLKTFKGYRTNSGISTILNKIPVCIREKSGLVLKFGIFMFAIQPLIDGVMHKCCNAIFGKDYDAMKDDEHNEAKKAQKQYTKDDLQKRLIEAQQQKNIPQQTEQKTQFAENTANNKSDTPVSANSETQVENTKNIKQDIQNVNQENKDTTPEVQNTKAELQTEQKQILQENLNTENTQHNIPPIVSIPQSQEYLQTFNPPQIQPPADNYSYIPSQNNPYNKSAPPKNQENADNADNYSYIPSQNNPYNKSAPPKKQESADNYTYIPSSENVIKKEKGIEERKYIPAQTPCKFSKNFDNSGLNDALSRADKAEQQALRVLSGNFDGMI